MSIQAGYVTNEVEGSFWRPYDYMAKVSNAHVIARDWHSGFGKQNRDVAATVSLSEEGQRMAGGSSFGKSLLKENNGSQIQYASEDGVVRRYSFNIAANNLELIDIAL